MVTGKPKPPGNKSDQGRQPQIIWGSWSCLIVQTRVHIERPANRKKKNIGGKRKTGPDESGSCSTYSARRTAWVPGKVARKMGTRRLRRGGRCLRTTIINGGQELRTEKTKSVKPTAKKKQKSGQCRKKWNKVKSRRG